MGIVSLQAHVLAERNKRMSLQAESEDWQRQLKRSQAKVAALGQDREDWEAKLRAKQVGRAGGQVRKSGSCARRLFPWSCALCSA